MVVSAIKHCLHHQNTAEVHKFAYKIKDIFIFFWMMPLHHLAEDMISSRSHPWYCLWQCFDIAE